ncbi:DNA-directed DNA polymerase gamma mip1 [Coemansia asiatica]|uniref:Mitochondrial DNA polymerase catalytic subunit n=1 Tax=Coemansia asiatica TaxID=1052880 RepID=A0A9W8CM08_9FUNG|nr:DNA-directed DNA polymerase gamma mip1 [Coemansia asiatica]
MLAPKLRQGIFKNQHFSLATREQEKISIDHLKVQGIYGKESEPVDESDFELPEMLGENIDEHFYKMGLLAAEPYLTMSRQFADIKMSQFPPIPDKDRWAKHSGWTRYGRDGSAAQKVVAPDISDQVLVFDVEIVVKDSPYPTLAVALSENAWYLWVSPYLTEESPHPRHLIPLMHPGQRQPRLVIGHNVGFDRGRIQEERVLKRMPMAFVDTMSLHVSSGGLCNQQRLYWMRYSKAKKENDNEYLQLNADTGKFFDVSSLNSLREVAQHYCKIIMDKSQRDVFVEGSIQDVRDDFANLVAYCARDVHTTQQVFAKVFPAFLQKCPHPVSFAGILTMLEGYLPVDRSWPKYIERSEELFKQLSNSVSVRMRELADEALKVESPMDDPWLRNLDWTKEPQKFTKPKYKADGTYAKNGEPRPYTKQRLPGYPKWYRDLWDTKLNRIHVTVRSRVAPYLLKLKWLGYPLYYSNSHGWTFRVPRGVYKRSLVDQEDTSSSSSSAAGLSADTSNKQTQSPNFKNMIALYFPLDPDDSQYEAIPAADSEGIYFKIPHADGPSANCGNPLSKGYQSAIEDGTLTSTYEMAKQAMDMNAMCSYWISARERVKSQFVVWDEDVVDANTNDSLSLGLSKNKEQEDAGVILPMVVPMGTITRRGVESTWMTASNAKKNRLGSELKSMVRCPKGFSFVGADVDSEELWISALIGDSQFRMHGGTAFGWMTLQGTKAAGTDLHSNSARILGIGRGNAKVFNYGRIYGAGVKYAISLLMRFNPDMTEADAKKKAEQLYMSTKGQSMRDKRLFGRSFWFGGSESYMFNQLEAIATTDDPRTPVLGCGITDALKKNVTGDRFMTSRVNWVVQSSGVDYLHMLLVSMNYLARKYRIDMRFVITVHDEVRYMVADHDIHRAALAMQVSNLWVRSLFSYRMGMEDLPQSVAFFSAVDIDHVLRKEVDMDCLTPTNTKPIPPGTSYSISETLRLTNGGRLNAPDVIPDSEFALVDHSLYDAYMIKAADGFEHAKPRPLTAVDEIAQPDATWLTAQMLNSKEEIELLVAETKRAVAKDRASKTRAKEFGKLTGGAVERRTIRRK